MSGNPQSGRTYCRRGRLPGFTLVEIMVALICMAILMSPIVFVFRSGSRTAFQGMVKAEITLEAKLLLRQIHDDLKYSVFFLDYSGPISEKPSTYFTQIVTGDGVTRYKILRFPLHGNLPDFIRTGDNAFRVPVPITYELKKEGPVLYSLYRKEGAGNPALLSRRVNFFEIRENILAPQRTSWIVTLQLAEVVLASLGDGNLGKIQGAAGDEVKSIARRLGERTRGVQIADFYDVVSSEFYSEFRKSRFIPNWQNLIAKP